MQPQILKQTYCSLLNRLDGPDDALLVVDVIQQQLVHLRVRDRLEMGRYPISTAAAGFGNQPDSFRTPTGWHQVREIIGSDAEPGQRFVSRKPEGDPLPEPEWSQEDDEDRILSRILRLAGIEKGNASSWSRYVYLHGTNQEHRLGTPSSHGCIRMKNQDIIRMVEQLAGTKQIFCWIGELTPSP